MNYGTYVSKKPTSKGEYRFVFAVPTRLRPAGWAPTIRLQVGGRDAMPLESISPAMVDQLRTDAEALYVRLLRERANDDQVEQPTVEDWKHLIRVRRESHDWIKLAPATHQKYDLAHRLLIQHFNDHPQAMPANVRESQIEKLIFDHTTNVFQRIQTLCEVRNLLGKAGREFMRPTGATVKITVDQPQATLYIWTAEDFADLYQAALDCGEPTIALLILFQHEVGQRLCSVRHFRFGLQYRDGLVVHHCRKTNVGVRIRVSPALRDALDAHYSDGAWMFPNKTSKEPFTTSQLAVYFNRVRSSLEQYDNRDEVPRLMHLRHTVVLELANAGCTLPEIGSITGHRLSSINRVIEHYLPYHDVQAANAMAKRNRYREFLAGESAECVSAGAASYFIAFDEEAKTPLWPQRALTPRETGRCAT